MIGILPAGGQAVRFSHLRKMFLPCPTTGKSLLLHHVDLMLACNSTVFVAATNGMLGEVWRNLGASPTHAFDGETETMTAAVLEVLNRTQERETILFGMPDTFFESDRVYQQLAHALDKCDVAVAVFKTRPGQHTQGGMVSFSHNQVTEVIDKPTETNLQYIWGALAWKPAFWDCLTPDMPHVGYGLPVAIERGLNVRAVVCEGGFWDCGTPERYFAMIRTLTGEAETV